MTQHKLTLTGLDGANPLAFLAALGTFRVLSEREGYSSTQLAWTNAGNKWTPVLCLPCALFQSELVALLDEPLRAMSGHTVLTFDKNLRIPALQFRSLSIDALNGWMNGEDTVSHQFLSAFGSDGIRSENGEIEDTALRTMSGAGHQHFLKFMNGLGRETTQENLSEALFGPWRYQDPGPSLRFDPEDDRRYAMRWKNPSQDAATTVRGANRLAVEGIPLLPVFPVKGRLETTGFTGHKSNDTFWSWPIWEHPVGCDVCRTLLRLPELVQREPDPEELRPRGIAALYRSQRITIGKFRNFTPARAV